MSNGVWVFYPAWSLHQGKWSAAAEYLEDGKPVPRGVHPDSVLTVKGEDSEEAALSAIREMVKSA